MTSARALRTLWRDEQPNYNPRTGKERAFERAWVIWPLFAYRRPRTKNWPRTCYTVRRSKGN